MINNLSGTISDGYSNASGKRKKRRRGLLNFLTAGATAPAMAAARRKRKRSKNGTKVRMIALFRDFEKRPDKNMTLRQWLKDRKLGTKAIMSGKEHDKFILPMLDSKPTDKNHKAVIASGINFVANKEVPVEAPKKSSADGQDGIGMEQGNDNMDEFEFAEGKSKDGNEGANEAVEYEDEDYVGGAGSMPFWKKAVIGGGAAAAIWYFFMRKK